MVQAMQMEESLQKIRRLRHGAGIRIPPSVQSSDCTVIDMRVNMPTANISICFYLYLNFFNKRKNIL